MGLVRLGMMASALLVISVAGGARAADPAKDTKAPAAAGISADKTQAGNADLVDRRKSEGPAAPAATPPEETALPANGVDPRPRRGVFADLSLGMFTTFGGSAALSNGQPFLAMTLGHDLGNVASIFLSLGIGASSASCFDLGANGVCKAADSFGTFFLEVGAQYGVELANRLRLSGRLVAGATQLAPGPVRDATTNTVPDTLFGFHGGGGLVLDYDTRLDHFAVGLDVIVRYTVANRPDTGTFGLLSLAAMPRIRYVF